jgi:hypothetical protein
MSDNRRVYRTIRKSIMQLYPGEAKGNMTRMLATLATMITGTVMGKVVNFQQSHAKPQIRRSICAMFVVQPSISNFIKMIYFFSLAIYVCNEEIRSVLKTYGLPKRVMAL